MQSELPVLVQPVNLVSGDIHLGDLALLDLIQELSERDLLFLGPLPRLDHGKQQYRHADQHYPENQSLQIGIHETSVPAFPYSLDAGPH